MAKRNSANQDFTNNADGWDLTGGATARKITVTGSDITLTGAGSNTYTFPSASDTLVGRGSTDTLTNKTVTALVFTAGTTNANTAPIQLTSGSLETVAQAGILEYNGNHYKTQGGAVRFSVGGTLFDHYADGASTSTNGTFDDLYTDTLAANTFNTNGDKITARYSGTFVSSATATRDIKVLFAGTTILDTSTLTTATVEAWDISVIIIRESATVVRCQATIIASTTVGAGAFQDTTYTRITGLTLSGTNILKIQGAAASTGAASGDITGKLGTIQFLPAI